MYIIDITKPPLGPPLRYGNCFSMDIEGNKKRLEEYKEYVKMYMETLNGSRQK